MINAEREGHMTLGEGGKSHDLHRHWRKGGRNPMSNTKCVEWNCLDRDKPLCFL